MPTLKRTMWIFVRAASHKITWYLGTRFPNTVPLTFVVGYPKSGTIWATQLVAEYLQRPFPRNSILPVTFPAVVHGHQGVRDDYPQAMYIVRDPRDAMVSRYFYAANRLPAGDHPKIARRQRAFRGIVNKDRVRDNLPQFIEAIMNDPPPGGNWPEHVQTYFDRKNPRVGFLRYEELLSSGHEHLSQALEAMTGQPADPERVDEALKRCSFARQSGRQPGQEDRKSFLRKGKAGDWRNYFSREAGEVLDRYCGEMMLRLGYIESRDWVDACPRLSEMT